MDIETPRERALVPANPMQGQARPPRAAPRVEGGFLAQIVAAHLREGDQRRRVRPGCARAHGAYRGPAQHAQKPAQRAGHFDIQL